MIWANLLAVSTSLPPLSLKQSLNELEGLKNESYECARRAKVKTKFHHNQMLLRKKFQLRQKVLLYNRKLHLFQGKLQSIWMGPYILKELSPLRAIALG